MINSYHPQVFSDCSGSLLSHYFQEMKQLSFFIFLNLILTFIFVMSFSVNIVSWNDKSECIKTSFLSRLGRLFP